MTNSIPNELLSHDVARVRWLCNATRDMAKQLCAQADVNDAPEIHCARFALHLVMDCALPRQYAAEVFCLPAYNPEFASLHPFAAHVRTLAFAATDLDSFQIDALRLFTLDDYHLKTLAVFRYAIAPRFLSDERLLELSVHEQKEFRRAVAQMLRYRATPDRNAILKRLIDDSEFAVSSPACFSAASTQDPELLDLLAAKECFGVLGHIGDPRARPSIKHLVESKEPLDWEEAINKAIILGDPEILAKTRGYPEWDDRAHGILGSAYHQFIGSVELERIVKSESIEHIAELLSRWPENDALSIPKLAQAVINRLPNLTPADKQELHQSKILAIVRANMDSMPIASAALLRLVSPKSAGPIAQELIYSAAPEGRSAAIEVVVHQKLSDCFAVVSEACLDSDSKVSWRATDAVKRIPIPCGIYGLDTAILRAGNQISDRWSIGRLINGLLERKHHSG